MGKKYLFIKLRAIGDTVILSSSIAALKKNHPDAVIDLIIPENTGFAFKKNPSVRKIYGLDTSCSKWWLFLKFLLRLKDIRGETYDYVLNFHASYLSALMSFLTYSGVRAVYNQGTGKKNLFSEVPIKGKGEIKSIIEKDYDVLRSIGENIKEVFPTEIFLEKSEIEGAGTILSSSGVNLEKKKIAIHPGASKETKKWITGYFIDLVKSLGDTYEIIFLHSSFEKNDIEKIQTCLGKQVPRNIHFIKTDSLHELALIIKNVDLLFVMDSGPKHIGVAVGIPTLTLFSSESMGEFHPYSDEKHVAIRADIPCRPNYAEKIGFEWCGLSKCESMRCMKDITPDRIYNEMKNFFHDTRS